MHTHQRPRADRADRRTSTSRRRSMVAAALALPLLAAACGSSDAADTASPTPPVTQQGDDIVSETAGALNAVDIPDDNTIVAGDDDGDDVPDYTDAELEVLLDMPSDSEELDPPEAGPLEADSPAAAIEAIEVALSESSRAADGTPILDQVEPLDDGPTATAIGIRDGRHINEAGEPIQLDEAAALACARVEIALTALDENRPAEAADHLRAASTKAADTAVTTMNPWSSILEQTAVDTAGTDTTNSSFAALLAFLSTCTQGGYEL